MPTAEIIYATIFMVCFVLLGGFMMYLSKTIDHGEVRFDCESGKQLPKDENNVPSRHPSAGWGLGRRGTAQVA